MKVPELKIGNTLIEYNIVRTNRKTLGINIDLEEGVVVRSPEKLNNKKIEDIVKNKSDWILKKLDKLGEIKDKPAPKEFMSGEKLPYIGRRYRLKVIEDENIKKAKVKLYQGKFIVKVDPNLKGDKRREKIRDAFISWYREHADKKIKKRVKKYKDQIGVEPNKIKVKKQKKRWGSCSNKGNLNFNWKLIMAPMSIIDYLVVHEMTHLIYPDHSREFWEMVETIIPDYKEKQEWLRINGNRLNI